MYTEQILGDQKDMQRRRRIVNVKFTNGETEFDQEFQFSINEDNNNVKKVIKQYLDELNTEIQPIEDLVVPEPEVEVPDPETVARKIWLEKWHEYLKAKKGMEELADAGITPTTEETSRFEALKQWVADNRKIEYTQYL